LTKLGVVWYAKYEKSRRQKNEIQGGGYLGEQYYPGRREPIPANKNLKEAKK